jgi:ryanodine receptor 2
MAAYEPRPIDTSAIELSDDLLGLTEKLAENAHDNWARRRMSEGWRWGPVRDDPARRHPDLVSYGELPEAEKHYDRDSALETLRAIIALGYRIEPANSD